MRMRTFQPVAPALVLALAVPLALSSGCSGDPNDPQTWAKQLKNLRTQKEALDHLANMDVEKARPAVPALIDLYKDTGRAEHLEALARYKDERTKALFIDALEYTDEDFDKATIAAGVLGDMKATDAIDPLVKAAEKPLPVKSRANNAKLAAMRALVKIGDKKATPTLMKVLTTSADEQDFVLNQKAALGLAELRDPQAVPALIKGLFMTGRGANIFDECRLALVRIGAPAVDPMIALLNRKNAEIEQMGKELKFDEVTPGVIPKKAAILLGDLRAKKAVHVLAARLGQKQAGDENMAAAIALGFIGDDAGVEALISVAKNAKADWMVRKAATDGLYLSGNRRAAPVLLELAKSGYITIDGQKGSNLRANAALALSRVGSKQYYEPFKALADKEKEVQGFFEEALGRLEVANECDTDLACYGKKLGDASVPKAEKAALAIGFSGDSDKGIPILLGGMKPLASISQERFPVHQAMLLALTHLGSRTCVECIEKLQKQIDRDEKAVRIPGARGLLAEARVSLAIIESKGQPDAPPGTGAALAATVPDSAADAAGDGDGGEKAVKGKKGKKAKKVAKAGGKKKHKKK